MYDLVGVAGNVVARPGRRTRGTGYAINGAARRRAPTSCSTASANNNEFDATVGQDVPLDSVQEFSVITNNFSAQYGRATGGIVNVATKSGTNTFRGTGYEFFRNEKLSANTFDNTSNGIEKGKFTPQPVGLQLGGPVVKDKLHFFSSLEYIRVRSADTEISWVPTPQFLAASAPATQAFFNAYGGGVNINGPVLTRGEVVGHRRHGRRRIQQPAGRPAGVRPRREEPADRRGRRRPAGQLPVGRTASTTAWARTRSCTSATRIRTRRRSRARTPRARIDGFDTGYLNKNHNMLGSFTQVFAPTFTSADEGGVEPALRRPAAQRRPAADALHEPDDGAVRLQGYRIAFPGYLPWSPGSAIPFGGPQKLLQFYQDQTWIKGTHDFRFGGSTCTSTTTARSARTRTRSRR